MSISAEGTIGILLALVGLAGAGAIMIAPQHVEIGWGLIIFSIIGMALLAFHHLGIRRLRMLPIVGMVLFGTGFVACAIWWYSSREKKIISTDYSAAGSNYYDINKRLPAPPNSSEFVLKVAMSFKDQSQIGTEQTDMDFYFSNNGDRDIIIQDVSLVQRLISNKDYKGTEDYRNVCLNKYGITPGQVAAGWQPISARPSLKLQDGTLVFFSWPKSQKINSLESESSSAIIAAKKSTHIAASFATEPFNDEYNIIALCPIVRFINNDGESTTAICAGISKARVFHDENIHGVITSPFEGTFTLLPPGIDARCRFTPYF
jgi:hypothetical protein